MRELSGFVGLNPSEIIASVLPTYVLELGTGDGVGASMIMRVLPLRSRFITVNLPNPPSGDDVGSVVLPEFGGDPRFKLILGDTLKVRDQISDGVDFLILDSEHSRAHLHEEWKLYEGALVQGALVFVDDIWMYDARDFWDWLPYNKVVVDHLRYGAGLFVYGEEVN